ncbi:MAG: hypothetical protein SFW09_06775 [Hyphomicrobiaceae bacterium]|nr:hypothetical protein [Hyphomicrobiaceae bacterium]
MPSDQSDTAPTAPGPVREAVGFFAEAKALQDAIDDLMTSGFDRAEIGLLASEDAVVTKLGHRYVASRSWRTIPKCHARPTSP